MYTSGELAWSYKNTKIRASILIPRNTSTFGSPPLLAGPGKHPPPTRIGFKSPATISQAQATSKYSGEAGTLETRGRHDPCVVPRAVPIVEAMAALVCMDMILAQSGRDVLAKKLSREAVDALPMSMKGGKKRARIE